LLIIFATIFVIASKKAPRGSNFYGSIISVVGKTTVEIIELFECRQKVP
jgi:hypothetical protein